MFVVVVYSFHGAHFNTVCIDGCGYAQTIHAVKVHLVGCSGSEEVETFQELYSEEKDYDAGNCHERDFKFRGEVFFLHILISFYCF